MKITPLSSFLLLFIGNSDSFIGNIGSEKSISSGILSLVERDLDIPRVGNGIDILNRTQNDNLKTALSEFDSYFVSGLFDIHPEFNSNNVDLVVVGKESAFKQAVKTNCFNYALDYISGQFPDNRYPGTSIPQLFHSKAEDDCKELENGLIQEFGIGNVRSVSDLDECIDEERAIISYVSEEQHSFLMNRRDYHFAYMDEEGGFSEKIGAYPATSLTQEEVSSGVLKEKNILWVKLDDNCNCIDSLEKDQVNYIKKITAQRSLSYEECGKYCVSIG